LSIKRTVNVTGCAIGSTCDSLLYYVNVREVSCSEWNDDHQEWSDNSNCQVLI